MIRVASDITELRKCPIKVRKGHEGSSNTRVTLLLMFFDFEGDDFGALMRGKREAAIAYLLPRRKAPPTTTASVRTGCDVLLQKVFGSTSGGAVSVEGEVSPQEGEVEEKLGEPLVVSCDFPKAPAPLWLKRLKGQGARVRLCRSASVFQDGYAYEITFPGTISLWEMQDILERTKDWGGMAEVDHLKMRLSGDSWWGERVPAEHLIAQWMQSNDLRCDESFQGTIGIIDSSFVTNFLPSAVKARIVSAFNANINAPEEGGAGIASINATEDDADQKKSVLENVGLDGLYERPPATRGYGHGHGILLMLAQVFPKATFALVAVDCTIRTCSSVSLREIFHHFYSQHINVVNFSMGFEYASHGRLPPEDYQSEEGVSAVVDTWLGQHATTLVISKSAGNKGEDGSGAFATLPRGNRILLTGGLLSFSKSDSLARPTHGSSRRRLRKEDTKKDVGIDFFAMATIGSGVGTSYAAVATTCVVIQQKCANHGAAVKVLQENFVHTCKVSHAGEDFSVSVLRGTEVPKVSFLASYLGVLFT